MNRADRLAVLFRFGNTKGLISSALRQARETGKPFPMDANTLKIILDSLNEVEKHLQGGDVK